MATIRVPATSANVGCGYDCLGLALQLYTYFTFEEIESGLEWGMCEPQYANEDNLVYTSFMKTLQILHKEVTGVRISIDSHVPNSRGLGSSATCVVGGIMGAYALTSTPIDKKEILDIATRIEGHPDNVAPAVYGGLRASCMVNEQTFSVGYDIDDRFTFQALVPDYEVLTKEARKAVPFMMKREDAIYSYSRLSVILKCFENYDLDMLSKCMSDKMHEPYRKKLIDEYNQVKQICQSIDSVCLLISGSGSTLLNILKEEENGAKIEQSLQSLRHHWISYVLKIDYEGAIVC